MSALILPAAAVVRVARWRPHCGAHRFLKRTVSPTDFTKSRAFGSDFASGAVRPLSSSLRAVRNAEETVGMLERQTLRLMGLDDCLGDSR